MRFDWTLYLFTLLTAAAAAGIEPRHVVRIPSESQTDEQDLYKRRGGGGRGGRGSSGGGSSGNSGGSGGRSSNTRPNSNQGGASRSGSGPQPSYGGGQYYGGGARTPYTAGRSTRPGGAGIAAFGLLGIGALAFWPGTWYGPAYMYRYGREDSDDDMYEYHNITTDEDEERSILCGCAEDEICACDVNDDVMEELIGNGSYAALNKSIIDVGSENGTDYFLLNGTLPRGTTLRDPDAAEDSDDEDASNSLRGLAEALGFWPAAAAVACAIFLS